MPPKKNVNKTKDVLKIPNGKVPRARIKKEKPKLKTPTDPQAKKPPPDHIAKEDKVPTVKTSPVPTKPPTKRRLMLDKINEAETSPGLTKGPTKRKLMLDKINKEKNDVLAAETSPGLTKGPTKRKLILNKINKEKNNVLAAETSPVVTKAPTKRKLMLDKINEEKNNVPSAENSAGSTKGPIKRKLKLNKINEGKNNVPGAETSSVPTNTPTKKKLMLDGINGQIATEGNVRVPDTFPALKAPIENLSMRDIINEVARAQLVKGSPVTEIYVEKKKRGRKKKIIEVEPDTKDETPQKKAKTVPDVPLKTEVPPTEVIPKTEVPPETEDPPKTEVIKKTKGRAKKIQQNAKHPISKPIIKRQITRAKVLKPDGTIVKRKSTRGKGAANDEDSTLTSPSILSQGLLDRKISKKPQDSDIDSRRTSTNSASEWSWTKDISGSSTTTCITVCTTDFVRIDKRLPVVKLHNIDSKVKKVEALREKIEGEYSLSENSTSSSSSSSSSTSSSTSSSICARVDNFLNLSTTSVSPSKARSPTYTPVDTSYKSVDPISTPVKARNKSVGPISTPVKASPNKNSGTGATKDKLTLTLEKFAAKLKCFDLEIWSDDEDDVFLNMKEFEVNIFKVMEEERGALLECNFLSNILSEKCDLSKQNADVPLESEESDFAKPDASVIASKPTGDLRNENSVSSVRRRESISFDDDDDALSIFAESITGIDSSRVSSSASVVCGAAPALVEYVPQPVKRDTWAPVPPRHYEPTPLTTIKATEDITQKTKTVCEKQNADSTSIQKESELANPALHNNSVVPLSDVPEIEESRVDRSDWGAQRQQRLVITWYETPPGIKCNSVALRGACFYNLISTCKKKKCLYPHIQLEKPVVANRLKTLSEHDFLQEFMHFARWPNLRMRYSKCFFEECQRRELPKFLVEMVIVYVNRANRNSQEDMAVKVDIIEHTMLYLNVVDFSLCGDLFRYKFTDGKFLCEVFMETIANTQNFWRFRNVFINLTGYMVRARRTFKLDVATQILERVSIFPFELPLALAILSILEHTDKNIFEISMMRIFEKQLETFNKTLHERFLAIKSQKESAPHAEGPSQGELTVCQAVAPLNGSLAHADAEKRYTSPDTTDLDSLNKPAVEPIIKRTVNLDKIRALAYNAEGTPNNTNKPYQSWNHRTIYDQIPRLACPRAPFGPHLRPRTPLKRPMGRQVLYGPRQFKFPRRFGPNQYGAQ